MKDIKDIHIGVDIGHGLNTPGKRHKDFVEHVFNSVIALKYMKEMSKYGFTNDNFVLAQPPYSNEIKLTRRYRIYDHVDFYMSLHADAHNNSAINGLSLYYWITSKKGKKIAETFAEVYKDADMPIRFKKMDEADTDPSDGTYDNMGILRRPRAPGLLIEHGYMTNDSDRELMSREDIQDRYAMLWARATVLYLVRSGIMKPIENKIDYKAKYEESQAELNELKRKIKELIS